MVRSLTLFLLALGCGFDPGIQNGQVQCSAEGDCPPGFECCNGSCVRTGQCTTVDMGMDAPDTDGPGADGACVKDDDGDGVCNEQDNCPTIANPGQGDCDGDGNGDACDPVYEAGCYGLRATLSSGGGVAQGSDGNLVGVAGEVSHSISSGPGHRLRGGLLPRAPRTQ